MLRSSNDWFIFWYGVVNINKIIVLYIYICFRYDIAFVPERSKGFDSSSNVFVLVGSNPTECSHWILLHQSIMHTILLHPQLMNSTTTYFCTYSNINLRHQIQLNTLFCTYSNIIICAPSALSYAGTISIVSLHEEDVSVSDDGIPHRARPGPRSNAMAVPSAFVNIY